MDFNELYPNLATRVDIYSMNPNANPDVNPSQDLWRTWRLSACTVCSKLTGWRFIDQEVQGPLCSTECWEVFNSKPFEQVTPAIEPQVSGSEFIERLKALPPLEHGALAGGPIEIIQESEIISDDVMTEDGVECMYESDETVNETPQG